MADNYCLSPFEKAIGEFKEGLSRRDIEDFRTTTLDQLRTAIVTLQTRLHTQRRLQDLNRLQPFLEAIEQYGKLVSTFYRNNDTVALIWTTSVDDVAFCELLNAYECIGEALPLLLQYRDLFRAQPHMVRVLALIYDDVLKFQRIILRYFQQPHYSVWQAVFGESWKTCKSRFSSIIHSIAQHRSLVESRATSSRIEEYQENIQQSRQIEEIRFNEQNSRRVRDVLSWLRPTNVADDQAALVKAREDYPGTGKWLLGNSLFNEWFDPQFPIIPPLLWLNGIPGAGKTVLASLVVQEAEKLEPAPVVLYFYCKHNNPERDNFVALGRSLLAQFLKHDTELLPNFYQEYCRSGETVLSSSKSVEELLTLAFGNCKSAYIILDGLDECPRKQREIIGRWFRELVENLSNDEPERLRCLFLSQDDGAARKDYKGLPSIKIRAEDSQTDIEEYCRIEAGKLVECHSSLPTEKANWIARTVASSSEGLFLLAKLLWTNLSCHTSIARLEEELEPNIFPKKINDAYRRIMVRITEQTTQEAKDDIFRLLGWLVCAKRPLTWHEIQGMNSINLERRRLDLERQSFIKLPKELLASLVETRKDGSLEFFHSSAKFFLLDEGHVVPSKEELSLATLYIDYLNLPAFSYPATVEGVLNGDYSFMDYAVLFWLRHLETGAVLKTDTENELMEQLAESLEIFINQHWGSLTVHRKLAQRHCDKLQYFRDLPFYDRLEQAVASTRRQLKYFGDVSEKEIALKLTSMVYGVREKLEKIASDELNSTNQRALIIERYGENLFKCPQFSCQFFTTGFSSASERDKHISKHERPFRCSVEGCSGYIFGFASEAQREKHMREKHLEVTVMDEEFPTEQEIEHGIMSDKIAAGNSQVLSLDDSIRGATTTAAAEQSESESEPEAGSHYYPRRKRRRQTKFTCQDCGKTFDKRYNLQSHRNTHAPDRPYVCSGCNKTFVRKGDLGRHMKSHTGEKKHVCHCGMSFARADTLRKHYESKVGRSCIQPSEQELGEPEQ
ncbi:putative zinc finger protein [Hypoxylon sp. FL1284]|nr:putative zinc finger protein [Hypoxylon sp. FL1284]